jgi:hypothetical protein
MTVFYHGCALKQNAQIARFPKKHLADTKIPKTGMPTIKIIVKSQTSFDILSS